MSRLRAVLDQINDIEATIRRIEMEATDKSSAAYRMTIESLEGRREMFHEDLADVTSQEHVEICDYRIVPGSDKSYAISAVTDALRSFQDLITLVYDAITDRPKQRASHDALLLEKTRFDFGFSYSGSLGVALVIQHDRPLFDSYLDQAVAGVFEIIKSDSSTQIHDAALRYGRPTVRKLYSWSKTHRDYGMTADIKWIRERETRSAVLAQPQELAEICRIIEERAEPQSEPVTLTGTLVSWDTVHRRFIIDVPKADPIGGKIADGVNVAEKRIVRLQYEFSLLKHTQTDYALDKDTVTWELVSLRELN